MPFFAEQSGPLACGLEFRLRFLVSHRLDLLDEVLALLPVLGINFEAAKRSHGKGTSMA
ncbi:hypothetical protein IVA79_22965 [Bradyrhizobium sp. 138]|uniref:hypothetical protein n=1 Tax=Bradyrhizobium sp. 138 TaxID=2782615 RepID=UPI001FF70432|nr:hypothetical protein [Bradyrhizobium sp. 138]MCK1736742.1 hypothetical protein [Bradyrhizobium sp. 138]